MRTALNLLPWRIERRQRRWRHSLLALVGSILVGGMAWRWLDTAADARLSAQRQQHQRLTQQLAELDAQIEAFERLAQAQRVQALTHARLEHQRLHALYLLDALARHTPDGVALIDVQQQGDTLTFSARAAASAQIARTVQQWHAAGAGVPILSIITSGKQNGAGYAFTVSLPWPAVDEVPQMQLAEMGR